MTSSAIHSSSQSEEQGSIIQPHPGILLKCGPQAQFRQHISSCYAFLLSKPGTTSRTLHPGWKHRQRLDLEVVGSVRSTCSNTSLRGDPAMTSHAAKCTADLRQKLCISSVLSRECHQGLSGLGTCAAVELFSLVLYAPAPCSPTRCGGDGVGASSACRLAMAAALVPRRGLEDGLRHCPGRGRSSPRMRPPSMIKASTYHFTVNVRIGAELAPGSCEEPGKSA